MASLGKKGKKHKGKTIALTTFLADLRTEPPGHGRIVPRRTWADEMESDDDTPFNKHGQYPVILPTAPRETRSPKDVDDENIPTHPPYKAYLVNLHYDTKEDDIIEFFSGMKITDVQLPRDDLGSGRLKGFGYIEFETRENLLTALTLEDTTIKGRRMRIEVSTTNEGGGSDRRYGVYGRRYDVSDLGPDRTQGDWRSGPRVEPKKTERTQHFGRSSPEGYKDRGAFTRDNMEGPLDRWPKDHSISNRDSMAGSQNRDQGLYDRNYSMKGFLGSSYNGRSGEQNKRNGGYGNRQHTQEFLNSGYDSRPGGRREYSGGFENRQQMQDKHREWNKHKGISYRSHNINDREQFGPCWKPSDQIDQLKEPKPADPKIRPKLKLQQRTICTSQGPDFAPSHAAIFGEARPVDTAAREREVESRLARQWKQSGLDWNKRVDERNEESRGNAKLDILESVPAQHLPVFGENESIESSNCESENDHSTTQFINEDEIEKYGENLEEETACEKRETLESAQVQGDVFSNRRFNAFESEENINDGYYLHNDDIKSGVSEVIGKETWKNISPKSNNAGGVTPAMSVYGKQEIDEQYHSKIEEKNVGERKEVDTSNCELNCEHIDLQLNLEHESMPKQLINFGEDSHIDTLVRKDKIEEDPAAIGREPKRDCENGDENLEERRVKIIAKKFEPVEIPDDNIWHCHASRKVVKKEIDNNNENLGERIVKMIAKKFEPAQPPAENVWHCCASQQVIKKDYNQ